MAIRANVRQIVPLSGLENGRSALTRSAAVHLMNAGWDVADVQDWLGHREISSTMVYAAVTSKRRAANHERSLFSTEIATT
jgi:site-specific recombinase XerD